MPRKNTPTIRDRIVELRRVRASELIPNPKNWRTHPGYQRDALSDILSQVGYADALLARETPDGLVLIDGHLRAETTPDVDVPVLILDVDEAEADLILATLDPLASMAHVDNEKLGDLLSGITTESDAVMALLESTVNDYRALEPIGEPEIPQEETFDTGGALDTAEGDAYVPFSTRGQIWQLGDHRLMCGDATSAEDVEAVMDGQSAEVLWTDPPYGVDYTGKTKEALKMANDHGDIRILLYGVLAIIDGFLEQSARIYIAAPPGALNLVFRQAFSDVGWRFHQGLVWVKDSMVLGHSDHHIRHEDILYGWKPGPGRAGRGNHKGTRWYGGHAQTSVFEIPRPKASREHPTMKPVQLIEVHLGNSSLPDDIVVDPFVGSGTTIIAAEKLGRRCYAMEIEPRYVDVAIRRWEAFTGKQAEKVS